MYIYLPGKGFGNCQPKWPNRIRISDSDRLDLKEECSLIEIVRWDLAGMLDVRRYNSRRKLAWRARISLAGMRSQAMFAEGITSPTRDSRL
ncbi:hypothetical protein PVK06_023520 [Gossypium arboreum]|uniref:Uncharacterized protein n=1 Tax=Gossypium arboreum TaxID=29729 RepID=A0ABR0PBI3_GOSAR|nr:hypothetical protein PVK06_023520 [Gossypium arboreum]